MKTIGGIFGIIGLIGVFYLATRPLLILVVDQSRKSGKTLPPWFRKIFQFVNKTHRYVGFATVGAIVLHFILQFTRYGVIPIPALIAGLSLISQMFLGLALSKQKDKIRRKKMALAHRILGMLIVTAVLVHRLTRLSIIKLLISTY